MWCSGCAAGPRARVGRVKAPGLPSSQADIALLHAHPRPGTVFERARARKAAEEMRKALADLGHWQATVEAEEAYDPRSARVDLTFRVSPGPQVDVLFGGSELSRGHRGDVRKAVKEGQARSDALEDAGERLAEALRKDGYRQAEVRYSREGDGSRLHVVYEVQAGPRSQVASVTVTGDVAAPVLPLRTRFQAPLRDAEVEADAQALQQALEDDGHASAQVSAGGAGGRRRAARGLPRSCGVPHPRHPGAGGVAGAVARGQPAPGAADAGGRAVPRAGPGPGPPDRGERVPQRRLPAGRGRAGGGARGVGETRSRSRSACGPAPPRGWSTWSLPASPTPGRTSCDASSLLEEGQPLGLQTHPGEPAPPLRPRPLPPGDRDRGGPGDPAAPERGGPGRRGPAHLRGRRPGLREAGRRARAASRSPAATCSAWTAGSPLFGRASFRTLRLVASYREPYLLGRRQELFVTAFREDEDRDAFDFVRQGVTVQTSRALTPRLEPDPPRDLPGDATFNLEEDCLQVDRAVLPGHGLRPLRLARPRHPGRPPGPAPRALSSPTRSSRWGPWAGTAW